MTPDQLDEIEKLAEAATPGPWRAQLSDKGHALFGPLPNGECGSMRIALSSYAAFDRANMLFAEAMRDATLPLVKALREAQKDLREARTEVARMKARPVETEYSRLDGMWQQLVRERDEARTEVERLKAALEEMRKNMLPQG